MESALYGDYFLYTINPDIVSNHFINKPYFIR